MVRLGYVTLSIYAHLSIYPNEIPLRKFHHIHVVILIGKDLWMVFKFSSYYTDYIQLGSLSSIVFLMDTFRIKC